MGKAIVRNVFTSYSGVDIGEYRPELYICNNKTCFIPCDEFALGYPSDIKSEIGNMTNRFPGEYWTKLFKKNIW